MRAAAVLLATGMLGGCGGASIRYTPPEDAKALGQLHSGLYDLITKEELRQLRTDAELGRKVGRYQRYETDYRTWRLDPATGQKCLLLAPQADWKKAELHWQSCSIQEAMDRGTTIENAQKLIDAQVAMQRGEGR